ncbi:MAG: cupin domain-containing protein [Bacteroidetes bacterium]|nr:cupin domain-containing protein [Bacteroidota bacterium]
MLPHPEGGYYKETYRSAEKVKNRDGEERNCCTAIYFLLEDGDISHFHRIQSDELWFFHSGQTLEITYIEDGQAHHIYLGNNLETGEVAQAVIPAGLWFASKLKDAKGYALVSCTVAPGFDFRDFEMAKREELLKEYPHLKEVVEELAM